MAGKGIYIAHDCHVVNALPPVDISGGKLSDVFSMKNFAHATIIIQMGVTHSTGSVITVLACDNFTPSNTTAIPFDVYKEETAAGDTLGAKVATAAAGFTSSVNDSVFYVIEVDASQLTADKPNLQVSLADPGGSTIASVVAILSGSRFAGDQNATAIA